MEHYDFVAIGDTVTDAFIRLTEAHIYTEEKVEQLCLVNGTKIPYESVTVVPAVGNSANAAVSAARLGLKSALVSDLGKDSYGDDCIASLTKDAVSTAFIKRHEGLKTNYHYVLWFRDERTILIKHEEYPYALPDIGAPTWIYFSSVGENSLPYHDAIGQYCATHPEVKLAFQPGTFQIKLGSERLAPLYQHCEVFFCNTDEARIILGGSYRSRTSLGKSDFKNQDFQDGAALARAIAALGPKIAVITDGPRGAYCYDSHTSESFFMPPYPDPKPPFERTGAGDAFSSTFTATLALGKSTKEALLWAPINSMSVVQKIGAQEGLLTRPVLEQFLTQAPVEYAPRAA